MGNDDRDAEDHHHGHQHVERSSRQELEERYAKDCTGESTREDPKSASKLDGVAFAEDDRQGERKHHEELGNRRKHRVEQRKKGDADERKAESDGAVEGGCDEAHEERYGKLRCRDMC